MPTYRVLAKVTELQNWYVTAASEDDIRHGNYEIEDQDGLNTLEEVVMTIEPWDDSGED